MSASNPISGICPALDPNRQSSDGCLRDLDAEEKVVSQRIPRRPSNERIPLSFSQQQVWLHSRMAGDIPIYNEAVTIIREGSLDAVILERCLAEIVRRHEIWRTTFDTNQGQPFQAVQSPSGRFPLRSIDLLHLLPPERTEEARCVAEEDARTPFDLKKGPLLRASVVRVEEKRYRLYLTFHQIVFDAVSAYQVLLPELTALYEAFSAGKSSPLPEPDLQYGDFAYWQQKASVTDAWSRQLSFWRARLSGDIPVLQWPNDRVRPAYQTHRGSVSRFAFDEKLIAPLAAFCRQENVSTYMACLAAYAALLSRYTEQQDIVIGGLSAGRRRSEVESTIGYFVNPLALRIDLSGNPTFRNLVRQVRGTVLDALANDEVPFGKVVEELQIRPDPSRNPIFSLILSQQPEVPAFTPGWELITEEVSNGGSKLDMTIVLDERPDGISVPITYNPDLFDASTIARLVQHWQNLLASAIATPDCGVSDFPLLSDSERQQILVDWNKTEVEYRENGCLNELIDAQAKRTPRAVALKLKHEQMTYSELAVRSNQVAHYLRSLGLAPGTPVGLYLERSFEMLVGLLGVLKAGGVCLPLDPTYPKDRLSFMLVETQARHLLTTKALVSGLPAHSANLICLDTDRQIRSMPKSIVSPSSVGPDSVAYIIYTSGSTGQPKGVQVTHGGLVNSTLARGTYYKDPVDTFLLLPSFAFDSSLAGIFWTLSTGGTIVLPPEESRSDLTALVDLMVRHRVSHVLCIPSLYYQLLEEASLDRVSSLRLAIVAGEECPKELVESHYRSIPHAVLFNEYGPTEATVWCSVHRCEPGSLSSRVPIGRPIANVQLYIVDSHLRTVPIGIAGELLVGGAGITRGYLNQPELTRQKFISNPFCSEPGSHRLYKTGDLARYLPDSTVEYLGRLDQQVKIRGFRIELGEIETALRACPKIREAAVSVREDKRGEKCLVAYVVPEIQGNLTPSALREHLKSKLPEYMVPSAFVFLEALPVSPNGKIDRRALPVPGQSDLPAEAFVVPRDAIETRLTEIWADTLGIEKIGIRHNLFDLGAHSLLVGQLLARVEREFGRRMTFASVFEAPTVEQFSRLMRKSSAPVGPTELIRIQPMGSKPPFFGIGTAFLWRPVSEHLGLDQPTLCIGFDPSITECLHEPLSLKVLASHFVQAVREAYPQGPYYLGGFCDHALLAYEVATQLLNQGHQVALLVLVDARNYAYFRSHRSLSSRIGYHIQKMRESKTIDAFRYLAKFLKTRGQMARRWADALFSANIGVGTSETLADFEKMLSMAQEGYEPGLYSGRVALFRASTKSDEALSGWRDVLTGPVETYELSDAHMGIFFEPHVEHLASGLAASLGTSAAPTILRDR